MELRFLLLICLIFLIKVDGLQSNESALVEKMNGAELSSTGQPLPAKSNDSSDYTWLGSIWSWSVYASYSYDNDNSDGEFKDAVEDLTLCYVCAVNYERRERDPGCWKPDGSNTDDPYVKGCLKGCMYRGHEDGSIERGCQVPKLCHDSEWICCNDKLCNGHKPSGKSEDLPRRFVYISAGVTFWVIVAISIFVAFILYRKSLRRQTADVPQPVQAPPTYSEYPAGYRADAMQTK